MADVLHVPAFEDNYIWLIRGASARHVAVVDPGDAEPVLAYCAAHNLVPSAILCTHHHRDHVGGIAELRAHHTNIPVYGPANEPIPQRTHPLAHGDVVALAPLDLQLRVLGVPGHTRDHIAYYGHGWLFCGDTLFSAGCGKLFEGTPAQMYESLARLAALPAETAVFCAHEYTADGLRFAAAVEPDNEDVRAYQLQVAAWRAAGHPSLPSSIGLERRINPFLRWDCPTVQAAAERVAGRALDSGASVFAAIRRWKDEFRG